MGAENTAAITPQVGIPSGFQCYALQGGQLAMVRREILRRPTAMKQRAGRMPPFLPLPSARSLEAMLYRDAMAWLSTHGGRLSTRTRDGTSEVVASAHNLAAHVAVKDLSDAAEVRRCELEAIWQLKQLIDD